MWLERLQKTPPYIETWLEHQRRDAYWRHGSVGEDYGAIDIPVYAVGGWADSYNNSIPRLLAGLSGPRKGLIGAWSHDFPETGVPGPAVGFLQESLRWWDHWLKGKETGIMDEPMLRCWIQESQPPAPFYNHRPGHWVADPEWPSPNVTPQTSYLNSDGAAHTLGATADHERRIDFIGQQSHGLEGGEWGSYGRLGDMALDQRAADGQSLAFTSLPLAETMHVLGYPEIDLTLAVDQPNALVAVRLCDVAPTGTSSLVSWGLLNLTHRDSHEEPTPLMPGQRYRVTVRLNVIGYQIPTGHCWRVAISPTYWRHAWPSPVPVTLSLFTGSGCQLRLPKRLPQPADSQLPTFGPAEVSPPLPVEVLRSGSRQQHIQRDIIHDRVEFQIVNDSGRIRFSQTGMETEASSVETYTIDEGEPLSATVHIRHHLGYRRDAWGVRVETDSKMTADATHFHLSNLLEAYEGDTRVFSKAWATAILRDHV